MFLKVLRILNLFRNEKSLGTLAWILKLKAQRTNCRVGFDSEMFENRIGCTPLTLRAEFLVIQAHVQVILDIPTAAT